ncbi:MAG: hypothetical protein EYC71_10870 [Gammaproteobacteria bacterium]|nr:MAG: hypothetical protein EYC71_10870 [Gammaproteobacteria bacterium]
MWKDYWCAGTSRSYWLLSGALGVAYVLAMMLEVQLDASTPTPLRVLAAVFPALLILGLAAVEFRRIRNTDELRQRMELEAGMLALAIGVPVLTAIGLLNEAELTGIPFIMGVPILLLIYIAAQVWTHRRYQ